MNNTKWRELQLAMHQLKELSPQWRTCCITNGYVSDWDGEWYYHFSEGGFQDIEWLEIKVDSLEQKDLVFSELKKIHVPGQESEYGFKVFGFVVEGVSVEYL